MLAQAGKQRLIAPRPTWRCYSWLGGDAAGVDLNPGMLSVAGSVAPTDSLSDAPLQWQEASADKPPFPDGSFGVVYCQLGLQFFADRAAALREMRRVLGAEGRFALMVWRGIH